MAWPERLAFSLALLVVLFGVFAGAIATAPGPDSWANPAAALGGIERLLGYGVLPLWGLFRIIDFLTCGPMRRRGRVRAQILR